MMKSTISSGEGSFNETNCCLCGMSKDEAIDTIVCNVCGKLYCSNNGYLPDCYTLHKKQTCKQHS